MLSIKYCATVSSNKTSLRSNKSSTLCYLTVPFLDAGRFLILDVLGAAKLIFLLNNVIPIAKLKLSSDYILLKGINNICNILKIFLRYTCFF